MQNAERERTATSALCIVHSAFAEFAVKQIPKVTGLDATVTAPPSKSYSVRALLLAAMAEGTTTVTNCLPSAPK